MVNEHPNLELLSRINIRDIAASKGVFSEDFVWHYFNPHLPDLHGDYVGLEAFGSFFQKLQKKTGGTFTAEPIATTVVGNELVIVHVRDQMNLDNQDMEIDAVVVWRVVDGRIVEAWDIPAVHDARIMGS